MTRYVVFDADSSGLYVVAGTVHRGAIQVERVAAHTGETPTLSLSTANALGHQLKALLKEAGIKPGPLLMCLARDRIILKDVKHPPTAPAQEPLVVKFQAARDLVDAAGDVVMDYLPLGKPVGDEERHAQAAFLRKDVVQAARLLADAAGLKLVGLTPRPYATVASRVSTELEPTEAVLTLSDTNGEFTVVHDQQIPFTRTLTVGSLASERELVGELKRNLSIYNGQNPTRNVVVMRVAEAEGFRGWADRLGTALPVPVLGYDPIADAPGADTVSDALHGRFAAAIGLLNLKAAHDTLPINFASPRQPRAPRIAGRTRIYIGAALGAIAFLLFLGIGYLELTKAESRYDELVERKKTLDDDLARLEIDAKRLAAADDFSKRELVWLDQMYDLADEVPDVTKVTVTEVEGVAIVPPKVQTRPGQAVVAKDTKPQPIMNVRIVMRTADPYLSQKLFDAFKNDTYFSEVTRAVGGTGSDAGTKGQQYLLTAKSLHRESNKYTRQLRFTPPVLTPPAAPRGPEMFGDFGGGFGP